jgi:hypothetical protein
MKLKNRGLCQRCGEPNTCEPYNVQRAEPTGRRDDLNELDVCELCWWVWLKKVCELFDEWRTFKG